MKNSRMAIGIGASDRSYLLISDQERKKWKQVGPFLKGESVNCLKYDPKSGTLLAATHTNGVFVSKNLGKTWKQSNNGLHVKKTWTLEFDPSKPRSLYVGTQYGHVFHSNDLGESWEEVSGLFTAPKRSDWGVDWGFGTVGLCIHTIRMDPNSKKKGERFYIVSSGGGPYRTEDQGKTWALLNKGVIDGCPSPDARADVWGLGTSDPEKNYAAHLKDVHKCTHKLVLSTHREGTLYQQNHCGVYRSSDFGESWQDISPSENLRHGFPIALIENGNGEDGTLFTLPAYQSGQCKKHNSCIIGELALHRSQNGGKSWDRLSKGLKKKNHTCVLRDAMTTDNYPSSGVYFGTTTGEVYGSTDLGENWSLLLDDAGRVQGLSSFFV
jgi:hypothetical protein